MTYLLFLLLLWPVTGWTGEPVSPNIQRLTLSEPVVAGDTIDVSYSCNKNGKPTACDALTNPCLATMEAAMRAMEPFLNDSLISLTPSGIGKKHNANKLWAEAKRCWKDSHE